MSVGYCHPNAAVRDRSLIETPGKKLDSNIDGWYNPDGRDVLMGNHAHDKETAQWLATMEACDRFGTSERTCLVRPVFCPEERVHLG